MLDTSHGLLIIPGREGDVQIGVESLFSTPLYWSVPDIFLGDKILAYNGYLRFSLKSNGPRPYSPGVMQEFPLVQLQGNHRIVLEHYPKKVSNSGRYEVRIHEDDWVIKGGSVAPATRETIMVALQNVQKLLIRASDTSESTRARLDGITGGRQDAFHLGTTVHTLVKK